jgi:hypothetical protein
MKRSLLKLETFLLYRPQTANGTQKAPKRHPNGNRPPHVTLYHARPSCAHDDIVSKQKHPPMEHGAPMASDG